MTGDEILRRQRHHDCVVCGAYVYDWETGLTQDGFPFNECVEHRGQFAATPKFNRKAERAKGVANLDRLLAAEPCTCGPPNECPRGKTVIETSVEVSVRCVQCGRTGIRSTNLEARETP